MIEACILLSLAQAFLYEPMLGGSCSSDFRKSDHYFEVLCVAKDSQVDQTIVACTGSLTFLGLALVPFKSRPPNTRDLLIA